MTTTFISSAAATNLRPPAFLTRIQCPTSRPSRHRHVTMAGKGFGSPKPPTPASNDPARTPERPVVDENYTPRGPTLKAEFERKGYIEPELGPDSGILPEVVSNRMLRRILTFGGVPFGLLFSFFAAYFVLKYKYDITVIPVVVAYSTLGTIGLATFGITYGIFSSSWDEDVEGSALGWEEAKTNFVRAKDGLMGARDKEKRADEFEKLDRLNKIRNKKDK